MKNIEYKCNICTTIKHKGNLMSFYWKSNTTPQKYILHENVNLSDSHICNDCIDVVVNFVKSLS